MLQSVIEYYRVLQSIAEYYRVLQNVTEYYRVFLAHLLGPIFGLVLLIVWLKGLSSGVSIFDLTTTALHLVSSSSRHLAWAIGMGLMAGERVHCVHRLALPFATVGCTLAAKTIRYWRGSLRFQN